MLQIIVPEMRDFLQPKPNEEPVDQPLYHIQSYGTGGATSFTFFQTAVGSATNGLSDTNMEQAGTLSMGKRFAVFSVGIDFYPGSNPYLTNATTSSINGANDAKKVLEGIGNVQFVVLNKTYLTLAPLTALPAGNGIFASLGGVQNTQASAADGNTRAVYATNGLPVPQARYQLRVPIPIPSQVSFSGIITFNSAITIDTASRIGMHLWGIQIRAKQ